MRLYIRQKGHKYNFFESDSEEEIFHGHWDSKWRTGSYAKIFDKDNHELVAVSLTKAPAFWRKNKTTYRIQIYKEDIDIEVRAVNAYKGHWTFQIKDDKYDFYFHYGLRRSLFKNDTRLRNMTRG